MTMPMRDVTSRLKADPVPKVKNPEPRDVSSQAGKYEEGDLMVHSISLTHSRALLGDGTFQANIEHVWLIDNEPYRLISLQERYLGWTAQVRRIRGRP